MYALYSAVLGVGLLAYLPAFLARRRRAGYGRDVAQRLGRLGDGLPPEPRCWIHAVSVGESRGVAPVDASGALARARHRGQHAQPPWRACVRAPAVTARTLLPIEIPAVLARPRRRPPAFFIASDRALANFLRASRDADPLDDRERPLSDRRSAVTMGARLMAGLANSRLCDATEATPS